MEGNVMEIAALVIGICSVIASIVGPTLWWTNAIAAIILLIIGIVGGIVGIIISANAIKKIPEKKGMGIGGLVTSIVALAYGAIAMISCVACVGCAAGFASKFAEESSKNSNSVLQESYNNMTPEEKAEMDELYKEIDKAISESK